MKVRDQISQTLRALGRPLSAYDVIRELEPIRGKLAPTTVYRALNVLVAEGHVHRIESLNAYVACSSQQCARHHDQATAFAICDDCGAIAEHQGAALKQSFEAFADQTGFCAARYVIEIHGRCGDCKKAACE